MQLAFSVKKDQGTHVHEPRENDSLNYETSDEQNLFTFIDNLKLFYPKKIGLIHDRNEWKVAKE